MRTALSFVLEAVQGGVRSNYSGLNKQSSLPSRKRRYSIAMPIESTYIARVADGLILVRETTPTCVLLNNY